MDWDDDDNDEEQTIEQKNKVQRNLEDDDSGDEKRKVRSPKEKLKDLIKEKYQKIKKAASTKNFVSIQECIEDLFKNSDKVLQLFKDESFPILFLEAVCICEDSLNLSKEDQKALKRENNIAFNNIKKAYHKGIKKFEEMLKNHKDKRPTQEELELEEKSEDEDESEKSEDDKDEPGEIDIIELMKMDEDKTPQERRLKWVKKEKVKVVTEKEKETVEEEKEKKLQRKNKQDEILRNKFYDDSEVVQEKVEEIITDSQIEKEIEEFSNQRGQSKRQIETVSRLDVLLKSTKNNELKIKLISLSVLICFDSSSGQFSSIPIELWDKIFNYIITLIALSKTIETSKDNVISHLKTNLISMLEKLETELYKALQFTDNNSTEYLNRIKDEIRFIGLCQTIEQFYITHNDYYNVARCYLLIIMHTYYKSDIMINALNQKFGIASPTKEYLFKSIETPVTFMKSLCDTVYQYLDEKAKIKAILSNVYFLSIRNLFNEARTLFNLSNSFELISTFKDEQLKTLFNRVLGVLGLAAFKNGNFSEVLHFLSPLCSNGTTKLKEYLSQSYNKESEKSLIFEKDDKKRATPHIMQINIDEIECAFFISSMLIDAPYILLNKLGTARHIKRYGNFFSRILSNFDKQIFNGPPETNKERILKASYFIMKGDWKQCVEEINQVSVFQKMKNYNDIKNMLAGQIKSTALKCYIIFYMKEYNSFDLNVVESRFDIGKDKIKKIINDMILEEEINGKWNKDILKIKYDDRDTSKMMKKLVDNVNIISKQNVDLLELAAGFVKKDD